MCYHLPLTDWAIEKPLESRVPTRVLRLGSTLLMGVLWSKASNNEAMLLLMGIVEGMWLYHYVGHVCVWLMGECYVTCGLGINVALLVCDISAMPWDFIRPWWVIACRQTRGLSRGRGNDPRLNTR